MEEADCRTELTEISEKFIAREWDLEQVTDSFHLRPEPTSRNIQLGHRLLREHLNVALHIHVKAEINWLWDIIPCRSHSAEPLYIVQDNKESFSPS